MIVLGIADNHDSGAALLIDGTLVAAALPKALVVALLADLLML